MNLRATWMGLALCASLGTHSAGADNTAPADGNAALRYWMAFALMSNPPASTATAKRLEQVASGAQAWSAELTPFLDQNREALAVLRRGAALTRCDWGLETELGADAPVAHLARARALARLNLLDGRRLLAEGQSREAVDVWLAGLRYGAHVAEQGPLLGALVGGAAQQAHLGALSDALRAGAVDAAGRHSIAAALGALPPAGFDWAAAARCEPRSLGTTFARCEAAADPAAAIASYLLADADRPAADALARLLGLRPKQLADRQVVRSVLREARRVLAELEPQLTAALKRPAGEARAELRAIDARARRTPPLADVWPALERIDASRAAFAGARAELLNQLGASHQPIPGR